MQQTKSNSKIKIGERESQESKGEGETEFCNILDGSDISKETLIFQKKGNIKKG